MSDFLNNPSFDAEGTEEFRTTINSFFQNNKPKAKAPKTPKKDKKMKVKIPEAPAQAPEEIEQAIKMAKEEMDEIRQSFVFMQDRIKDLALYPFIFPHLEDFANACQEMLDVVEDNINKEDLSAQGKKDYDNLLKVRARILSSVYNKYKKEE